MLNNQPKWSLATTTGGNFQIFNDATGQNALAIFSSGNTNIVRIDGDARVIGNARINGFLEIGAFSSGADQPICRGFNGLVVTCGSSIRYKSNVNKFSSGLNLISRLRPVTFNWKANNGADLGLIAEEFAKVEPLLVTHNEKGEVEGVKYDRVAVVLINAVKEQQAQIDDQKTLIQSQQKLLETQQRQIKALKKLVCSTNPGADVCNERE